MGQWARVERDAPPLGHTHVPPRRASQAVALPLLPYVSEERQEHLDQLQGDGDGRLPVHPAECIVEDNQGRCTDVAIIILQSLHDLWQQALQSRCLHETHKFIL